MTSKEIFDNIISMVDCSRGAPMGRSNHIEHPIEQKLFLREVPLDKGGYDKGGTYWGLYQTLYCAYNGEGTRIFIRANSRESAKKLISGAHRIPLEVFRGS